LSWKRPLARVIKDKRGRALHTLHDARAYALKLGGGIAARQDWKRAIELMLVGAEDGDTRAVTQQIKLAMLIDGVLDLQGTPVVAPET
jgi:hypothetical protein